jgi:hypothetical protein
MTRTKDPLEGIVKVVHSGTCPSLSGKSQISYQIGRHPEGAAYLRVIGNTGGGFFSPEWVALTDLKKCIDEAPDDRPLSSWTLHPIFRGKSVNTPAFLSAALVHEKWLRILKGKKRGLEVYEPKTFEAKLEKLVGGKADSHSSGRQVAKKKSVSKKAPMAKPTATKKKAMPAKKKKAASV